MTANSGARRRFRLAYLVTHPIQYQAPLLRRIAEDKEIDLTVFFQSDISLHTYQDPGFNRKIAWDVPLVEGYAHEFLPTIGTRRRLGRFLPINYGLGKRLRRGGFDAFWIHGYGRWYNLAALVTAKWNGVPVLLRDEAHALSRPRSRIKRGFKRIFFYLLDQMVGGYLAIGSLNRDYYRANGIVSEKIFLMPYAVDNDFFMERSKPDQRVLNDLRRQAEIDLEDGAPVILYASKFEPRKRPGDLLRAYETVCRKNDAPAPHLVFIGDGEERENVARRAKDAGLERVHFLGFKNQTELPGWFSLADIFVLPSQNEPWGLVVNEAMCGGCAILASHEVGAAADLIEEGVNGFTFAAGNVDELAGALAKALVEKSRLEGMKTASLKKIRQWGFAEDISGLKNALTYVTKLRGR